MKITKMTPLLFLKCLLINDVSFQLSLTTRLLQLGVYVSDQVPDTLVGDPGRIRQIITNFMGNSIKVSFSLPYTEQRAHFVYGTFRSCI